jgi:hypothetical protein
MQDIDAPPSPPREIHCLGERDFFSNVRFKWEALSALLDREGGGIPRGLNIPIHGKILAPSRAKRMAVARHCRWFSGLAAPTMIATFLRAA